MRIVDRESGEIIEEWENSASEGADLPFVVLDAAAYTRGKYQPERMYFDVERAKDV